jgi:hypothetical protein
MQMERFTASPRVHVTLCGKNPNFLLNRRIVSDEPKYRSYA